MNKRAIANTLKSLQKTMRKRSPAILIGTGIAGIVAAVVITVRATSEAFRMVDGRETEDGKRPTTSEIVRTTWKYYIPVVAAGVCSAARIIGASPISARRNATLVTAYIISETVLKEYEDRVAEAVGPRGGQTTQGAVAREQLEQAGVPERKFILAGRGETSYFGPLTNACFKSNYGTLRGVEGAPNKWLWDEIKITIDDFLEELGLPSYDPAINGNLGWDMDKRWVEFDFSFQLMDGISYLVTRHRSPSRYIGW